jgi:hypothetical protein
VHLQQHCCENLKPCKQEFDIATFIFSANNNKTLIACDMLVANKHKIWGQIRASKLE